MRSDQVKRSRPSRLRLLAVLSVVALLLASCASGPATQREKSTATGALIGAGAGAIIGNQSGDAAEGAAIGAALGGLAGAAAGDQQQQDRQRGQRIQRRLAAQQRELGRNRRLRARLRARDLSATVSDRGVVVTVRDLLFACGSSSLTPAAHRETRCMADAVRAPA
nr:glycine zipper 2TM domain-containing protein [Pseudomonadota bacterium]